MLRTRQGQRQAPEKKEEAMRDRIDNPDDWLIAEEDDVRGIQDDYHPDMDRNYAPMPPTKPKRDWTDHAFAIGLMLVIALVVGAGVFFPVVFVVLSWVFMGLLVIAVGALFSYGIYSLALEIVLLVRNKQ